MVVSHTSDRHEWFVESRTSRTNARADWYVWADAKPDGSPPNNWLSIFGGVAWHWDSSRLQYYLHNFLTCQPDLNFHCPGVQDAILAEVQFWLERGVDGLRLDTVNFYFHSRGLENNPPVKAEDFNDMTAPAVNPYNFQDHVFDKSQPENLKFLTRLRTLLNRYPGRTSLGEIGDSQRQMELMAKYTSGNSRLHMAYTFDFLGGLFDADYFARTMTKCNDGAPDGWMCCAFSNHDVTRHVSRWSANLSSPERDTFACLCASLLLCMRGSVCLYQGEELGLTETDLSFEELVDPYGIEFWPKYKGRDGCRTPMPWNGSVHLGGFTSNAKSWLPIPSSHLARAVNAQEADQGSVLHHYRKMIAFRRQHPVLINGAFRVHETKSPNILAFLRSSEMLDYLCVFNLSATVAALPLDQKVEQLDYPGSRDVTMDGKRIVLPPHGWFIGSLK
jgi:alpha-glucosidase